MKKCTMFFNSLLITLSISIEMSFGGQSPYQVSLHINLHSKTSPVHICNGVIVQSRVILTSATCVFYDFDSSGGYRPLHPSQVLVVAGTTDEFNDALVYPVNEIQVLDTFNPENMENDLAVIRLNISLPLSSREDINWIVLDDYYVYNNFCLANFYYRKSTDYIQSEELPILDINECTKFSRYVSRKKDLCSYSILPLGFNCKYYDEFIRFNSDRGTGMICNSRLVAILSTILPITEENIANCSETLVKTLYTHIGPHLDWIYNIIAFEEYIDITHDSYVASTPYRQEASPLIQSSILDFEFQFPKAIVTGGTSKSGDTPKTSIAVFCMLIFGLQ